MLVRIGPYRKYIGIYQLTGKLSVFGVPFEKCTEIGDYLAKHNFINVVFKWFNNFERRFQIRIDPYDTFNLDDTMARIILPLLQQLKTTKQGSPYVDQFDVPSYLRDTPAEQQAYRNSGITNNKFFKRWDWVLEEIIFAFTCKVYGWSDSDLFMDSDEVANIVQDRIDNGLYLFAKYYESLWD